MGRRPIPPKPIRTYQYQSDTECEESGDLHRVEVKVWPPPRSRVGEAIPTLSARCTRCNCHLQVEGTNDPVASGIEVVVLEKEPHPSVKK